MVAARLLYPEAVAIAGHELAPQVAAFLALGRERLDLPYPEEIPPHSVDKVILVDTQSPERVEGLSKLLSDSVEWLSYDHHPPDPKRFFKGGEIRTVGAATTILVGKLLQRGIFVKPFEATLFALGIHQDTGNLTHPSTQPEDARALAVLLEWGADLNRIMEFSRLSPQQNELLKSLEKNARISEVGEKIVLTCFSEGDHVGGAADAVDHLAHLHGADVALAAVKIDGKTLVVGRSNCFDVRTLLAPLEGKGHPGAAAGHTMMSPREAIDFLEKRVSDFLPPPLRAAEVMNSPVRTVDSEARAIFALERLVYFGHGALAITEKGNVCGMISRKDLEKAVRHGLGEEPVGSIGDRRVLSVPPDAPLSEILSLMGRHGVGRLLVTENENLLGIITRSDLIWALEAHPQAEKALYLGALLEKLWPPDALAILQEARSIFSSTPLYLVGGAVRDLLLGRPNLDIDLVVEGDAIRLAESWARQKNYRFEPHPPFGTALLVTPNGFEIDVAMAREEYYPHPNALPIVEPASIRQDLFRRDFTVNAMGLDLSRGKLVDPFGGREDLEKRVFRVLHRLSFIEDPTRILRGIRLAVRLGFSFEENSQELARYSASRLGETGGERFKREVRRLLEEGKNQGISLLFQLEGEQLINRGIMRPAPGLFRRYFRLKKLFNARIEGRYWLAGLALLLLGTEVTCFERLLLGEKEKEVLKDCLEADNLFPLPEKNSALYFRLKNQRPELLLFLAALAAPRERKKILSFFFRLRGVVLEEVSGYTLKELGLPPGPAYRVLLDEILAAKLDGKIEKAEDESSLAKKLAARHSRYL
jgi:tRNA nucleotidyltransferase (CCA-adding enzyme)